MITEHNDMHGALMLRLTDAKGKTVHEARYRNHIVTTGRNLVAQLFAGQQGGVPPTKVTHIAVGSGVAPEADADAALATEIARKPITTVNYSETVESDMKRVRTQLTTVFDFGEANGTLTEAGIFTAETGGVMYNRVTFGAVTKTDAFKLTLIWDVVF